MEERKMAKNMRKIFLGILIVSLSVFISGIAVAGSQISISGVINEDGQLVDNNGMTYDIADNDEGNEVMEMVGQKVAVKGTVMETEGTKIITVTEFNLLEE
jgi:predicted lipoprotein with Yx(FWY)xxD motif